MKPRLTARGLAKWFGRGRPPENPQIAGNGTWALAGIDLELGAGVSLGLVGPNGAGKTTLLRLIAGVLAPTTGTLETHGRITSVLELAAPFASVLSGEDNLKLALLLQGASEDRLDPLFHAAAEFSGLRDRLKKPLATYSQGMILRLGFSAATADVGDLLLLDEVLLVGDEEFQLKCNRRILEAMEKGTSVIFASHDLYRVENMCRRTVWLESGEVESDGASAGVIDAYQRSAGDRRDLPVTGFGPSSAWVDHKVTQQPVHLRNFRLLGPDGLETRRFQTGDPFGFELDVVADGAIPDVNLFLYFYRNDGLLVSQTPVEIRAHGAAICHVRGRCEGLPFTTGDYSLNVAIIPVGLVVGYYDHETCRRIFTVDNTRGNPHHRAGLVTFPIALETTPGGASGSGPRGGAG